MPPLKNYTIGGICRSFRRAVPCSLSKYVYCAIRTNYTTMARNKQRSSVYAMASSARRRGSRCASDAANITSPCRARSLAVARRTGRAAEAGWMMRPSCTRSEACVRHVRHASRLDNKADSGRHARLRSYRRAAGTHRQL